MAARVRALETILTQKGLIDAAAVDAIVETYEQRSGRAMAPGSSRAPGAIRLLPNG